MKYKVMLDVYLIVYDPTYSEKKNQLMHELYYTFSKKFHEFICL